MNILGVKIDNITLSDVLAKINNWLNSSGQHYIATVNPEFVVEAQKNQEFKEVLNSADLAICDGFGLVLAGKILTGQKLTRITGVDLTLELLNGQMTKWLTPPKFYLLGGREGIAEMVKNKFPQAEIVGAEAGGKLLLKNQEWLLADNDAVISRIKKSGANILLVAFGQVKQELWIAKNLAKMENIKVAIGVGGSFDYLSGQVPRAPKLFRAIGLEWLFRLIREPKRIGRIYNATIKFGWMVAMAKLGNKK